MTTHIMPITSKDQLTNSIPLGGVPRPVYRPRPTKPAEKPFCGPTVHNAACLWTTIENRWLRPISLG
jgi:hypothetical protein